MVRAFIGGLGREDPVGPDFKGLKATFACGVCVCVCVSQGVLVSQGVCVYVCVSQGICVPQCVCVCVGQVL